MASKTQICNRALILLGKDRLTDVDTDGTTVSELCNIVFDDLVDEVLSSGQWSNAIFRVSLNQLEDAPTYGYDYAYQLPTLPKILKVIDINDAVAYPYKIEDGKLLTDASAVSIRYIGRLTDTDDFGVYITRVLIRRIALELSYTQIGDKTLSDMLRKMYTEELVDCLASDNQQGTRPQMESTDLIDVR